MFQSGNPGWDQAQLPRRERAVFRELQEREMLRGGVLGYAAQGKPQFDAEIAENSRSRMGAGRPR
jgi:hypothetical protein